MVTVFCVGVPAQPLPTTGRQLGLDLGVHHLATTSDGDHLPNYRLGQRSEARLRGAQRELSRKKRGGANRRRAAQRVGAIHRKVARQRLDHAHKLSRSVVNANDVIVHEALRIANLTRRPPPRPDGEGGFVANGASAKAGLNRSILDAGWGLLLRLLAYKAEDAGRTVIAVGARHTSQTCHGCGHVDAGNRLGTVFRCLRCGHVDDADTNAARNILRAGLAQREQSRAAEGAQDDALSFAGP
jgi:putative transposase